ncbi:MAG: hypothetical protein FGM23_04835 [Alphaproteobacteria bacterium]|nr:hypothetical protein [Alphaproteobacteria bacterium]
MSRNSRKIGMILLLAIAASMLATAAPAPAPAFAKAEAVEDGESDEGAAPAPTAAPSSPTDSNPAAAAGTGQASKSLNPNVGSQTGLPLPRFVSLRTAEVNARTGPGKRYPIDWVYKRKNLPVQVVDEFGTWRKIREHDGTESWIHQTMVSGKDTALVVTNEALLYDRNSKRSRPIARLQSGLIAEVVRCQDDRCQLQIANQRGWVGKADLWGALIGR